MIPIYFTLVVTYLLALFERIVSEENASRKYIFLVFTIAVFCVISGLRNGIGDTGDYIHLYRLIGSGEYNFSSGGFEIGFIWLLEFLNMFSNDPQLMIFMTAAITSTLNILVLNKYKSLLELQIFMYVVSGYFLVTMNGIRQAFAAAIIFAGTKLIIEGKVKSYICVALLGSLFHTSALIMIPIYFISRLKAWSRNMYIILFASAIAFVLWSELLPIFLDILGTSKYGEYDKMLTESGFGANPIRAIISFIPIVLAYLSRDKLQEQVSYSNIFVNMSIINFLIMCFAMYNWIFARFTLYFQPYTFILLPLIIQIYFPPKQKAIVYYLFIIFYILYFYYEHVISLNIIYGSNYLKF